jgi:hypothetical protein
MPLKMLQNVGQRNESLSSIRASLSFQEFHLKGDFADEQNDRNQGEYGWGPFRLVDW